MNMKTLLLIDTHALIHRFFHALPPLTTPDGQPIGAIYGLCGLLLKILSEQKPDYIAAAFDRPEPTFRDEIFKEYKTQRPPTADELVSQLKRAYDVFDLFKIKTFSLPGFEADDLIGSLVEQFSAKGALPTGRQGSASDGKDSDFKIVILSGDNDLLQLVENDKVLAQIIKTGLSETVMYNEQAVEARYGLKPAQLADYKGLTGDASDNIPGVTGIGPKTAVPLIKEFGSVEGIYENLGLIPEKTIKKLENQKEVAMMSKKLAIIRRDAPIAVSDLESLKAEPLDKEALKKFFGELGFQSLIKRLESNGE